ILETSRETDSQSSIEAPSPLSRSSTTRRTENRPAPAVSTASSRQPFSAAAVRICSVVISLNFIEQKSGPLPAPQTPNQQSFIKMDTPVQLACDAFRVDPDRNGARNEIDCPTAALESAGGVCVPTDEACSTLTARMTSSPNPTIDPYSA